MDVASLGLDSLLDREWLLANGIGGYACSTVPGLNTRKYHGLLVAAMTPPVRRMVLLSHVDDTVHCDGWPAPLSCNEYPGTIDPQGHQLLRAFEAEPFPRWIYQGQDWTLEKSLRLVPGENTVVLTYTLLGGQKYVDLDVRPLMSLRPIHNLMYQWNGRLEAEDAKAGGTGAASPNHHRVPATARTPEVFFAHDAGTFDRAGACWYLNTIYRRETERGYGGLEDLWSPGVVRAKLAPGQSLHFVCSADPIDFPQALEQVAGAGSISAKAVRTSADPALAALTRAAEPFVLSIRRDLPSGRSTSTAVISQYPWAAPSGRDALIAITGLLLVPGRYAEARSLLASLASQLRDGLIPTAFPEDGSAPRYDGADTSLWFVNAVHQYLRYTGDAKTVRRSLLEPVLRIIDAYQHGIASPHVRIDDDGLLIAGSAEQPATWMNAVVGGVPVTPRCGKPVELNALWYNALRVAAEHSDQFGHARRARTFAASADAVARAFNAAFWNEPAGYCYDAIGEQGPDASVRPNQLLAVSLPFPVLAEERWAAVVEKALAELRVPTGVRTLSRKDPAYRGRYMGDESTRDRAHHQGSAFAWLLGPLVTAYVRTRGGSSEARREAARFVEPLVESLRGESFGLLRELYDGDAPHRPGGALASGVAVGELLRCYSEDVLGVAPAPARDGERATRPVAPRSTPADADAPPTPLAGSAGASA